MTNAVHVQYWANTNLATYIGKDECRGTLEALASTMGLLQRVMDPAGQIHCVLFVVTSGSTNMKQMWAHVAQFGQHLLWQSVKLDRFKLLVDGVFERSKPGYACEKNAQDARKETVKREPRLQSWLERNVSLLFELAETQTVAACGQRTGP